jgi:hypothetical protein
MNKLVYLSFSVLVLAGCSQEQSATYEVPKAEQPAAPVPSMGGTDADNQAIIEAHTAMMERVEQSGYEADLPEGWTEKGASGMRMASYSIEGTSIDFYLTSLTMGDVPSNVNRWRGQIGLEPTTPEAIAEDLVGFEVDGHTVGYIEIYNEESGRGIIAAIVDLSPNYWYFTAKGTVEELKANAGDIRAFIESIKIN